MGNQRQIKRRISAAKNISQITKAMEMVSASKMRRAQQQALAARPYTRALHDSLQKVAQDINPAIHPLLQSHTTGKPLLIVVSTDKGLVGGLNNHLFKESLAWLKTHPEGECVAIGKKAVQFCRLAGATIHAQFTELPEKISTADIAPLTTLITQGFLDETFQSVSFVYMDFINTLSQQARVFQLLPLQHSQTETADGQQTTFEDHHATDESTQAEVPAAAKKNLTHPKQNTRTPQYHREYEIEPSPAAVLNDLLPYYIENTIYQTLLEARASEHSSRMVAMKNASENAGDLVKELRLVFNKNRQASITSELLDITTASLTIT